MNRYGPYPGWSQKPHATGGAPAMYPGAAAGGYGGGNTATMPMAPNLYARDAMRSATFAANAPLPMSSPAPVLNLTSQVGGGGAAPTAPAPTTPVSYPGVADLRGVYSGTPEFIAQKGAEIARNYQSDQEMKALTDRVTQHVSMLPGAAANRGSVDMGGDAPVYNGAWGVGPQAEQSARAARDAYVQSQRDKADHLSGGYYANQDAEAQQRADRATMLGPYRAKTDATDQWTRDHAATTEAGVRKSDAATELERQKAGTVKQESDARVRKDEAATNYTNEKTKAYPEESAAGNQLKKDTGAAKLAGADAAGKKLEYQKAKDEHAQITKEIQQRQARADQLRKQLMEFENGSKTGEGNDKHGVGQQIRTELEKATGAAGGNGALDEHIRYTAQLHGMTEDQVRKQLGM